MIAVIEIDAKDVKKFNLYRVIEILMDEEDFEIVKYSNMYEFRNKMMEHYCDDTTNNYIVLIDTKKMTFEIIDIKVDNKISLVKIE